MNIFSAEKQICCTGLQCLCEIPGVFPGEINKAECKHFQYIIENLDFCIENADFISFLKNLFIRCLLSPEELEPDYSCTSPSSLVMFVL